jgi:hypothetical protein
MIDDTDRTAESEHDATTSSAGAWHRTPRRRVLRALGGASAVLAAAGVASAGNKGPKKDDDHETYDGHTDDDPAEDEDGDGKPEAPTPAEPEKDLDRKASVHFDAQVTDGTYIVADDVVVPTAGFLSIHQLQTEIDGDEFYYVNRENGGPQNAAQTIVGYSEYLEPGIYDEVRVEIYEDDDLPPVGDSDPDRLEDPAVLLALMHIDGNDNEQWDLFDNEDIVDAAYDFGDTDFAPPFDRPSDIAAIVPIGNDDLADEFEISR